MTDGTVVLHDEGWRGGGAVDTVFNYVGRCSERLGQSGVHGEAVSSPEHPVPAALNIPSLHLWAVRQRRGQDSAVLVSNHCALRTSPHHREQQQQQ